jgi:predicted enzyme related to lactoylglutathione lyase
MTSRRTWVAVLVCAVATAGGCGDRAEKGDEPSSLASRGLPPIVAMNAFYYYEDLDAAWGFYTRVLGFATVADHGFAKILRVGPDSYLTLMDEHHGVHSSSEPKTATLAVVTDEVEGWWDYLNGQSVEMRAPLGEVGEGRPHDGFVAIDPEGYFLEFERFNPHPENEILLPMLHQVPPLFTDGSDAGVGSGSTRPSDLGVRGTVLWLYYQDLGRAEAFYQDLLGVSTVVDQGWAKVLPASPTGFVGLVDGGRGLHRATDDKAVTVSFITDGLEDWLDHAGGVQGLALRAPDAISEGEFVRMLVGHDPEGYHLEWNDFLDVELNRELLRELAAADGLGSHFHSRVR